MVWAKAVKGWPVRHSKGASWMMWTVQWRFMSPTMKQILRSIPIVTLAWPLADSMNMTWSCFKGAPSLSQMSQWMMTTWHLLSRIPVTIVDPLRITSRVLRGNVGAALRRLQVAPMEKVETVWALAAVGRARRHFVVVASLNYFLTSSERARSSLTERNTFLDRTWSMTVMAFMVDSTSAKYLN